MPDFSLELSIEGLVCGLDEVGRGPLAGPVVAACVYVPEELYALPFIAEIKDSKKLSKTRLTELYALITERFSYEVCEISPQEIDEINILQASLKAMRGALLSLRGQPSNPKQNVQEMDCRVSPVGLPRNDVCFELAHALVDGNRLPADMPCPATAVVKGDNVSTSIAAASIVAKVHRDRIMKKLAVEHPHYGWESNAGYPSPQHLAAIEAHGITRHHRKSFAPVRNFIEFGSVKKRA